MAVLGVPTTWSVGGKCAAAAGRGKEALDSRTMSRMPSNANWCQLMSTLPVSKQNMPQMDKAFSTSPALLHQVGFVWSSTVVHRAHQPQIIFGGCCGLSKKYTQIIHDYPVINILVIVQLTLWTLVVSVLCQLCSRCKSLRFVWPNMPSQLLLRCRRSGCAVETICFHQLQQIPEPRVRATNIDYPVLGPLQDCKT